MWAADGNKGVMAGSTGKGSFVAFMSCIRVRDVGKVKRWVS